MSYAENFPVAQSVYDQFILTIFPDMTMDDRLCY